MSRKRARAEAGAFADAPMSGPISSETGCFGDQTDATSPTSTTTATTTTASSDQPDDRLHRLRNTWEFACLVQYLFLFGKTIRLKDVDLDELETACMGDGRTDRLAEIGIALLKFTSGTKSVNRQSFETQARKQYAIRAPDRNPFGAAQSPSAAAAHDTSIRVDQDGDIILDHVQTDDGADGADSADEADDGLKSAPLTGPTVPFSHFDLFEQIRILHQLSVWTFVAPERIRGGAQAIDQTEWRIEPFGWDGQDRAYFLLDDDRLYRMSDQPRAKTKGKTKQKKRRVSTAAPQPADHTLGGKQWECLAVSLADYESVVTALDCSDDPNEKILVDRIRDDLLPVIERREADRRRIEQKRQRELDTIVRLATAKRSSRIAERRRRAEVEARSDAAVEAADEHATSDTGTAASVSGQTESVEQSRQRRWRSRVALVRQTEAERQQLEAETGSGVRSSRRQLDRRVRELDQAIQPELGCVCGRDTGGPSGGDDDGRESDEDGVRQRDGRTVECVGCRLLFHSSCVGQADDGFTCSLCAAASSGGDPTSSRHRPRRGRNASSVLPADPGGLDRVSRLSVGTDRVRSVSMTGPVLRPSGPNSPLTPVGPSKQAMAAAFGGPSMPMPTSAGPVVTGPRFVAPADPPVEPAPQKHLMPANPLPANSSVQLSPTLSARSSSRIESMSVSPVSPISAVFPAAFAIPTPAGLTGPAAGRSPAKTRVASMPISGGRSPALAPMPTLRPSPGQRSSERISRFGLSSPVSPISPSAGLGGRMDGLLPPSSAGLSPRKVSSPMRTPITAVPFGPVGLAGLSGLTASPSLPPGPAASNRAAIRAVSMGGLASQSDIDPSGLPALLSSSPLGRSPVKQKCAVPAPGPRSDVVVPKSRSRRTEPASGWTL